MTTLKELLAQQAELAKRIEEVRKAEVAGVIEQVKAIVEEYELTVEDIFPQKRAASGSKDVRAKEKGPAKYQHPDIPTITWSGKGRKPEWVKVFLANENNKLEQLKITSN